MKSSEIRKSFTDFFQKKEHNLVLSSSLVPHNDPTIMFTNAGMNQFKNIFLGLETPSFPRAVSIQKCVRAGGKHNDLENVGYTKRHHTFFEMMGNFSFGDYFREEAISYAWEFLVQTLGLDKKNLYISVFQDDEDSFRVWHEKIGVPKDRIYRFGKKDNFWSMGDVGPCGPCTEIYYDIGSNSGDPAENIVGGEGDRYMEIWNLVLMAYEDKEDGSRSDLRARSVDTGAGLERLACVLQNKDSNYHTDVFMPLLEKISSLSGREYSFSETPSDIAMRVLSDHARAACFLLLDGVMPSSEGRGYVLRRIIRRALRYARNLNLEFVLEEMVKVVISQFSSLYPDLKKRESLILSTVQSEEQKFLRTLDQGIFIFEKEMKNLKKVSGDLSFKLYDTYGFPFDLTCLMAKEKGYEVDTKGFETSLKEQQQRSRQSRSVTYEKTLKLKDEWSRKFPETNFLGRVGYDEKGNFIKEDKGFSSEVSGKLLGIFHKDQDAQSLQAPAEGVWLVFDKTCFYAESGGQTADEGALESKDVKAQILDCQISSQVHFHLTNLKEGELKVGETYDLSWDKSRRLKVASHHSTTHLLNRALKEVLSEGCAVEQKGSFVTEDRLRFDFTCPSPLSVDQKIQIEKKMQSWIDEKLPVVTEVMTQDEAYEKGAVSLIGETYDSKVRVLTMGDSIEFCGGTHVSHLGEIETCFIAKESAVSSGVRRLEVFTGKENCEEKFQERLSNLKKELPSTISEKITTNKINSKYNFESFNHILNEIEELKEKLKQEEKQKQKDILKNISYKDIVSEQAKPIRSDTSRTWVFCSFENLSDGKALRKITQDLHKSVDVVILLGSSLDSVTPVFIASRKDLPQDFQASYILKEVIFKTVQGSGGGKPDFSQGSIKENFDLKKLEDTLEKHMS